MVTRYVNTASTAGGDGTTNGTAGANRAYATLAAAAVALAASNFNDDLEILCCGVAADPLGPTFSGATYVTVGHTVYVRANSGVASGPHGGKWNPLSYKIDDTSTPGYVFQTDSNTALVVDGIQLFHTQSGNAISTGAVKRIEFLNCLFKASAISPVQALLSTFGGSGSDTIYFNSCVFLCYGTTPGYVFYLTLNTKFYNCIINGGDIGILVSSGSTVVKNCSVFNNTNDFLGTMTIDHCASDDGDGTNPIVVADWSSHFYNSSYATDVDFRLKSTSTLLNAGVGPTVDTSVPTTDIIGLVRSGNATTVGPFKTYANPVRRYVNTASTAGGDGTTNNTTGATRAYAGLQEAATALASANFSDDLEIFCCGSAADSGVDISVAVDGMVTAGHTVYIKANRSVSTGYHGGKWNTGTYRLEAPSGTHVLIMNSTNRPYILDGLQIHSNGTVVSNLLHCSTYSPVGTEVRNCIMYGEGTFGGAGISSSGNTKVENCVVVNTGNGVSGIRLDLSSPRNGTVYNTITTGWANGNYSARTVAKNCMSFNNSNVDFYALTAIDRCASDDGDGTNPVTVASWAAQFINPNYIAELDFRIKPSCTLSNAGIGPTSDAVAPATSMGSAYRYGTTTDVGPFNHSTFKQKSSAQGLSTQGVR